MDFIVKNYNTTLKSTLLLLLPFLFWVVVVDEFAFFPNPDIKQEVVINVIDLYESEGNVYVKSQSDKVYLVHNRIQVRDLVVLIRDKEIKIETITYKTKHEYPVITKVFHDSNDTSIRKMMWVSYIENEVLIKRRLDAVLNGD